MLTFKPVTLCDKPWVDEMVMAENSRSADYTFGNIYNWNDRYKQLICNYGGRMHTKLRYEGRPAFVFPIGKGDLREAIEALREFTQIKGYPLFIRGLTEDHVRQLEAEYPGSFDYAEEENFADYVYLAEKLASYSGKALHSKKNHCNRFEAEHDWQFLPMSRELIPACMDMLSVWSEENAQRLDGSIHYEYDALVRAFAAFERLGLEGGVLMADGKIVGFSIGEFAGEDCIDVHFEKADGSINGAYPMVCREFVRMLMNKYPQIKYINREDDMGLENLRRSKLSYKPEFMLRKFTARWRYE